ncbi:50S ribosomal protein L10 [Ureaplasma miroungigenitalium]|uniref:Large ribosomal subunit protein uL10 n=1 Tax=Ureaplasma miroungigenitalium TaxID=1042321 RepID=A0ABT3BN88_9BACT|nr:50S ribosomal protein L10 [Ureaplasma miroungigenitalium]MCV3728700.1 50S ribosomal protein L10 [Ureaplasma miroungigenitalium]MCV3734464.1 50S ribosomal protein L10 [Ureaplasma miroungigenitalium]
MSDIRRNIALKQSQVDQMAEVFKNAKSFIVFEYKGLNAASTLALRNTLHASNARLYVLKNNITRRAFEKAGVVGFEGLIQGPNAIAVATEDEIAAIKAVHEVSKEFNFIKIKGAYVENTYAEPSKVSALASIPGREGLYSMLLSVLTAPLRNVLYGIKAVAEQKENN